MPVLPTGLAALAALLAAGAAGAQTRPAPPRPAPNPETTAAERVTKDAARDPGPTPKSSFGTGLSLADARALLGEMRQLTEQALATSRAAEQAASVADVKAAAGRVLQAVWGAAAGRGAGDGAAEIDVPGWKERWQVTGAEFDADYAKRLGTLPPKITDPRQLGVMGRGRAVRGRLQQLTSGVPRGPATQPTSAEQVIASISNVVGWTYVTEGLKGREQQPRISLTHVWDAPPEFWNSSADTGWLDEVFAQAANILKTDYANDVAEARRHAAGMSELLQKVLAGVDADRNGSVEPKMMEGGLNAALEAAGRGGL